VKKTHHIGLVFFMLYIGALAAAISTPTLVLMLVLLEMLS